MSQRDILRSQIGAFVMLPTFVLDCCRDANAIHVYAIIARHINRERQAWPGQERIAEQMGASLRTVQRGLEVLKAAKVLSTQPRRENGVIVGTVYTLLARPDYVPRAARSSEDRSQDVVSDGLTGHKSTRQSYTPKRDAAYKEELDPIELDPKTLLLTEPTADARNPIAVVFDAHDEGFRKITISEQAPNGQKPTHTGKDRGVVKHLLKAHAVDRLVALLGVFFASEDPFIERSGYTLGVFASQIDKLVVDERRVAGSDRRRPSRFAGGGNSHCPHTPTCGSFKVCTERVVADGRAAREGVVS